MVNLVLQEYLDSQVQKVNLVQLDLVVWMVLPEKLAILANRAQ